jgi:hypothetical protein
VRWPPRPELSRLPILSDRRGGARFSDDGFAAASFPPAFRKPFLASWQP